MHRLPQCLAPPSWAQSNPLRPSICPSPHSPNSHDSPALRVPPQKAQDNKIPKGGAGTEGNKKKKKEREKRQKGKRRNKKGSRHTPHQRPNASHQVYNLGLDARVLSRSSRCRPGAEGWFDGRGRGPAYAGEEAIFGEDGYGVYEEDGDCLRGEGRATG